jgi:hypothetical protein
MKTFRRQSDPGRDAGPGRSQLDELVDAARASGTARELSREDHEVLLFQQAQRRREERDRRPGRSPRRSLQAVVAAGGIVAVTTGGLAFAASGHPPWSQPTAPPSIVRHTAGTGRMVPSSGATAPGGPSDWATTRGRAVGDPRHASPTTGRTSSDDPSSVATNPGHPTHPVHPTHPSHPTHTPHAHPSHPIHPIHPTHTPHPAHPGQPSRPTRPRT